MDKLLKLLDTNARLTNAQLAVMLDRPERGGGPDRRPRTKRRYPCV